MKQTANTQPALLTTSVALHQAFAAKGFAPDYVAGHSLGEYSALTAAGALAFEDAVSIVRARGEYMEQAVPGGQGAMAAVLGGEREALAQLCADITAGGALVELANVNCPGQIVVSGSKEGVAQVAERVKEIGAKRAIPLEVSGPFHSSLMRAAAERLEDKLKGVTFKDASVPVVANVTASPVQSAGDISKLLVEQVYSPVLWEDSVAWLIAQGVDTFVEIGPGKRAYRTYQKNRQIGASVQRERPSEPGADRGCAGIAFRPASDVTVRIAAKERYGWLKDPAFRRQAGRMESSGPCFKNGDLDKMEIS
ncbi:hypothetical protein HMSSN036_71460 [Paenibacillus macerans]|nr:hypothetical protein HMSSN036_71460 [Paenibacillus macerans]